MIEVKQLRKNFDTAKVDAVGGVSFRIETGETACIVGTSGCGKTTTLKMINRLIEPTSGEIFLAGHSYQGSDPIPWRRKIGYVVQKAGLLPHLTIESNISLLAVIQKKTKKEIRKRVQELMALVDLPWETYAKNYPAELSGGQQQRVGIARALMADPSVMLMDEPFGALDPITRSSLHEQFIHLNKKMRKTILMVTHDLDEAFLLGDKVILMNEGLIVQTGTKEELVNHPTSEFAHEFFASYRV